MLIFLEVKAARDVTFVQIFINKNTLNCKHVFYSLNVKVNKHVNVSSQESVIE